MPIRINLLAEAHAAAEERRKNPVKRAIWIGGFLVSVMVLWIVNLQLNIMFEQKNYNNIDADSKSKMAKYASVTNELTKIAELEKKLGQLDYLSTNRFLWGPVLNALQQTVADDVQMTQLKGVQTVSHEGAHDKVREAMVEKITLEIAAKDLKPAAENYNKFKKSLSDFDFFNTRLQKPGFIMDTLGQISGDPVDPAKQFVTFTLGAKFPEARHE